MLDAAGPAEPVPTRFMTTKAVRYYLPVYIVGSMRVRKRGSRLARRNTRFFWSQDATPHQNRYIGVTETTIDPGMSYEKLLRSEQVLDIYGNVTSSKTFNFNNTSAPLIQRTFTYQTGSQYTQRFISNRQTGSTTTHVPTGATTVTAATYDNYPGGALTPRSGLDLHDAANYGQSLLSG